MDGRNMHPAGSWLVCSILQDVAHYEHIVRLFMLSTHTNVQVGGKGYV